MKRRQALALLTLSPLMTTFPVLATNADQAIDLSAQLGKVVLIDFWASWCGPCRQSFPWLNRYVGQIGNAEIPGRYLSSDYRLDEFSAITLGLQYRFVDAS